MGPALELHVISLLFSSLALSLRDSPDSLSTFLLLLYLSLDKPSPYFWLVLLSAADEAQHQWCFMLLQEAS